MVGVAYGRDNLRLDKILKEGQKQGAKYAFFVNDNFWHFYKKGSAASKHCWLFMPVRDQKKIEWKISYNLNLDTSVKFYRSLGYKVELIEIPQE